MFVIVKRSCYGQDCTNVLRLTDFDCIGLNLDKSMCVRWIGETYLEVAAPTERLAVGRSEFLNVWKDLLPETWRNEAYLANLPVSQMMLTAYMSRTRSFMFMN